MGSTTTAFPDSLLAELPQGIHDFAAGGDVFKVALIKPTPAGTYDKTTTNYSELVANGDEVPNGMGYTTGGFAFTPPENITPALFGDEADWSWTVNPSWAGAAFSAQGCLIYNASKGGRAVYVGDFGGVFTGTGGSYALALPPLAAGTAILALALG